MAAQKLFRLLLLKYNSITNLVIIKMKRFAVYGMRRSGNHAFTEWLLKNCSETDTRYIIKDSMVFSGNSCYLNDITGPNSITAQTRIDHMFACSTFQNIIVTYEDRPTNQITEFSLGYPRIVILRDIRNVAASRYKRFLDKAGDAPWEKYMRMDESFFKCWLEHSYAIMKNHITAVKFEDWVCDKEYRDRIANKLALKNIDSTKTVSHHGGGSSFDHDNTNPPSPEELNERWKKIELPEAIKRRINSDDIQQARAHLGYKE